VPSTYVRPHDQPNPEVDLWLEKTLAYHCYPVSWNNNKENVVTVNGPSIASKHHTGGIYVHTLVPWPQFPSPRPFHRTKSNDTELAKLMSFISFFWPCIIILWIVYSIFISMLRDFKWPFWNSLFFFFFFFFFLGAEIQTFILIISWSYFTT